jgi:hypothetical protein
MLAWDSLKEIEKIAAEDAAEDPHGKKEDLCVRREWNFSKVTLPSDA